MASSALAALSDPAPPPPPPPTSDVSPIPIPKCPNPKELTASSKKKCLLPLIEPSLSGNSMSIVKKTDTSPTGNDFLPPDLLFALKRQDNTSMGPSPPRGRKSIKPLSPSTTPRSGQARTIRPPAQVWGHPNRRERFKHLTDAPPCICGSGKDISFLYDSAPKDKKQETKVVIIKL